MKKRIFTLMMAFLAVASGAVWGQTGSITINSVPILPAVEMAGFMKKRQMIVIFLL